MISAMHGPAILARTLTEPTPKGKLRLLWQYHSRSDHHSQVACWGILFDLLLHCHLLRQHAEQGRIVFGVNRVLRDFKTGKKKKLDLVIATPTAKREKKPQTFVSLGEKQHIRLDAAERSFLASLPPLEQQPVGLVHLALEAKACMTEHGKAGPRLFDELNSSHEVVHGSSDLAIAAGFAMINIAPTFISPGRNKSWKKPTSITKHDQPRVTESAIANLLDIPRRTRTGVPGFDALAILLVHAANDGSPVSVVTEPPAPQPGDPTEYSAMIARVAHLYESRFPHV
jgi:hypothetical protein